MPRTQRIAAMSLLLLLLQLLALLPARAEERLVLSVTLIRHGDRTPFKGIPGSAQTWKLGLGELTPLGMNQEYLLGKSLRERYVDQFRLLPANYVPNVVYARSTTLNRTIMSAQSLLCGLYPPGTGPMLADGKPALPGAFQPVPIRTWPAAEDRVLLGGRFHGDEVKTLKERLVFTTGEWQEKTRSCSGRFARWSRISGLDLRTLTDLIPVADEFNVRGVHGVPFPEGITDVEAREIVGLGFWAMAQEYRPREIGRLLARDLLAEVMSHMEKAHQGTQPHRLILYSAHDSTLLPVLSALGVPRDTQVPYASNVIFELSRDGTAWSVRVRYNGEDLVLPDTGKAACSYEEFRDKVLVK